MEFIYIAIGLGLAVLLGFGWIFLSYLKKGQQGPGA